jgi:hypothetical protein
MNTDDLANFQPDWKSLPSIPTRIPGEGASVNFAPCSFQDGAKVDSMLPEKEIPQSNPQLRFYCWKDGVAGTILLNGGGFAEIEPE